jgi:hypothetical protein
MRAHVLGKILVLFVCGCSGLFEDSAPLTVSSVSPVEGSVAGGTRITLTGSGFDSQVRVTVGDVPCESIQLAGANQLSCVTGDREFVEGAADIAVTRDDDQAVLAHAFEYRCEWTTSTGRRSCGAAPARQIAEQVIDTWVTQFQGADGFEPDAGPGHASMADTADFVLGSQSAFIETNGTGVPRTLSRTGMPAIDFTDRMPKVWIKLENVEHVQTLDLVLGDSNFANSYVFKLASTQGQQYTTEGDWVAFTVSWDPQTCVTFGNPRRNNITDVMLRVTDDQSGTPVRLRVNGLGLVKEPVDKYPDGVVTFTFDDGFGEMLRGSELLAGLPATAYVIVDMIDRPGRVTVGDLNNLQDAGWDVAVHANTDLHHSARYNRLPEAEVEDDMVSAREWLIQQRFRAHDHCSYPGGEFTGGGDVLSLARKYFASCRTIYTRHREAVPASDARKLRVFYVTRETRLEAVQAAIDHAKTARQWIILVFHKIVDGAPAVSTEWSAADFTALVQYVRAKGVPVATVSQVLE